MTQNLQKIFKNLKNVEPSRGLEGKILKAISLENSRKVARKLMMARAGLAVSFGALAYTLFVFGRAFSRVRFLESFETDFFRFGYYSWAYGRLFNFIARNIASCWRYLRCLCRFLR